VILNILGPKARDYHLSGIAFFLHDQGTRRARYSHPKCLLRAEAHRVKASNSPCWWRGQGGGGGRRVQRLKQLHPRKKQHFRSVRHSYEENAVAAALSVASSEVEDAEKAAPATAPVRTLNGKATCRSHVVARRL